MTLRDSIKLKSESFREAFDKVVGCIDTTDTIEQFNTTEKLYNNFIKLYDSDDINIYRVFLQFRLEVLELELKRGIDE